MQNKPSKRTGVSINVNDVGDHTVGELVTRIIDAAGIAGRIQQGNPRVRLDMDVSLRITVIGRDPSSRDEEPEEPTSSAPSTSAPAAIPPSAGLPSPGPAVASAPTPAPAPPLTPAAASPSSSRPGPLSERRAERPQEPQPPNNLASGRHWYVVFVGYDVGVFFGLHRVTPLVLAVSGGRYRRASSRENAEDLFALALSRKEVRVVPHPCDTSIPSDDNSNIMDISDFSDMEDDASNDENADYKGKGPASFHRRQGGGNGGGAGGAGSLAY